jgi:outer membrane autotransporter protein
MNNTITRRLSRAGATFLRAATLLVALSAAAQAQTICAPTVSPSPLVANQVATLNGNCTVNGVPATAGTEVWTVPNGQGGTATLNRPLAAPPLTLSFANAGAQDLNMTLQTPGGNFGPFAVQVAVQAPDVAASTRLSATATPQQLAAIAAVRTQLSTVVNRLRYLRTQSGTPAVSASLSTSQGSVSTTSSSGEQSSSDGQGQSGSDAKKELSADGTQTGRLGVFIAGGLENAKQEATATGPGFRTKTTGAAAGADYRFNKQWVLGAGLAVLDTNTKFTTGTGKQFAKGRSATFYGSWMPTPAWYVDAAVSIDRTRYELQRDDPVGDAAFARTKGKGQGVTLSAGYDKRWGAWSLSPFARAEMVDVRIRPFEEFGSINSLEVGEQRVKSGNFTLGGQLQYNIGSRWGIVTPYARIEATRTFEDNTSPVRVRLVGSSTALLLDESTELRDQSFGNAAVGVAAQMMRGISLFADAEIGFGQANYKPWRLNGGMKVEF